MITQAIIDVLFGFIQFCLLIIPNIPSLPSDLMKSIDSYIDLIFGNLQIFSVFVRPSTITILVPLVIALYNADKVYAMVMWVINKIPFVGAD